MSNLRVRKPPGGESTFNIFGVPNEPKTTQNMDNSVKATTEAQEQSTKIDDTVAQEDKTEEIPEDTNENEEKKEDGEEQTEATEEKFDESALPSETNASNNPSAKEENQSTQQGTKNKHRAGYNPITGQPYSNADEKTEAQKAVGPTRVRQPPGGASSKLW